MQSLLPLLPLVAVVLPPAGPTHVGFARELRSDLAVLAHCEPPFVTKGVATEDDRVPCSCTSDRKCWLRMWESNPLSPGYGPGMEAVSLFRGSGGGN